MSQNVQYPNMRSSGRIQVLLIASPFCCVLSPCADFSIWLLFSPGICWLSSICLENVIKTLSVLIIIWQLELIPVLREAIKLCDLKIKNLYKYLSCFQYSPLLYPRDTICFFSLRVLFFSFHLRELWLEIRMKSYFLNSTSTTTMNLWCIEKELS